MIQGAQRSPLLAVYLLSLAFAAGFSMMLVEVTATRLLAPFFGTSNYTWTNVIGAIMGALAGGYYLGGKLADRWPRLHLAAALALVGGLLTAAVPAASYALSSSLVAAESSDLSAAPLFVRASLVVALVVFAPPVALLGALSPLVVRLLADWREVGWASGANSAFATGGSILGTFAPTLWLIPWLGSRITVAVAAGLLILIAGAGFVLAQRRRAVAGTWLALGVLPLSAAALPEAIRPIPGLVEELEGEYQYARVVRADGRRELQVDAVDQVLQSILVEGSHLTGGLYFDHLLGLPFLAERPQGSRLRVLILGLGAATLSRQLHHFFGESHQLSIDGVEIDPGLIALGERHFDLGPQQHPRLRVYVGDARFFLTRARGRYDVIAVDVFSHQYIPSHMATLEFFRSVRERLAPGGVMGMNVVMESYDSELFLAVQAAIGAAFGEVWRQRLPKRWNVHLVARRDRPIDRLAAQRAIEGWVGRVSESSPLAEMLLADLSELNAASRQELAARPLTDDWSPTEQLAHRDLRRAWEAR